MYFTFPSSTISETRTPVRTTVGPDNAELALAGANRRSLVSLETLRRKTNFSRQDCKPDKTCWLQPHPNSDQRSESALTLTLSAAATSSFSIVTPLPAKKLFCAFEGSPTKSCMQAMNPSTPSPLFASRSNWMLNLLKSTPRSLECLTTNAVSWKTRKETQESLKRSDN